MTSTVIVPILDPAATPTTPVALTTATTPVDTFKLYLVRESVVITFCELSEKVSVTPRLAKVGMLIGALEASELAGERRVADAVTMTLTAEGKLVYMNPTPVPSTLPQLSDSLDVR